MANFTPLENVVAVLVSTALAEGAVKNTNMATPQQVVSDASTPHSRGLDAPLSEQEAAVVDKALARGASVAETTRLVARWRGVQRELRLLDDDGILEQPEPEADPAALDNSDAAALPLAQEVRYRQRQLVVKEYNDLPPDVQKTFEDEAPVNGASTGLDSYSFIRRRLWEEGWQYPSGVFHDIKGKDEAKFYRLRIDRGAHQLLVKKLGALADEQQYPGWRKQIKYVQGFQPRRIANKDQLSNHVFGLAIDIDANFNPHIKSREAIGIILRHTDPPVDFGERLLVQGADIQQVYEKAQHASDQIRDWLNVAAPVEKALVGALDAAINHQKNAEGALRRAKTEEQRRAAAAALEQAEEERRKATEAMGANWVLVFDVGVLRKEFGAAVVDDWAKYGILTVPLDVVKRLHNELGFGWGVEYELTKDFMHFELNPRNLLPDMYKKQGVTGLEDLEPPR